MRTRSFAALIVGVLLMPVAFGSRAQKARRQSRNIGEVTRQLGYLEELYPSSIGEACFIDVNGEEFARVVRGRIARPDGLSTVEEQTVFFAPTFALDFGQVHQTRPYVSPDTTEWVVANATLIPQADDKKRAFVHFEVTMESIRRAMGELRKSYEIRVLDGRTGKVVIDGGRPQRVGTALGTPRDARYAKAAHLARSAGVTELAGHRTAYRHMGSTAGNANDWIVVASAKARTGSLIAGVGPLPFAMLAVGLVIIAAAPALGTAARLVRSSHEAFDGNGYPDALVGVEIPLGARIIAVCDAFDAMISNRPYSRPKTIDEALAELERCAGTQFDPAIVSIFKQVIADRAQPPTATATA